VSKVKFSFEIKFFLTAKKTTSAFSKTTCFSETREANAIWPAPISLSIPVKAPIYGTLRM
jgi:hypothetical protein